MFGDCLPSRFIRLYHTAASGAIAISSFQFPLQARVIAGVQNGYNYVVGRSGGVTYLDS